MFHEITNSDYGSPQLSKKAPPILEINETPTPRLDICAGHSDFNAPEMMPAINPETEELLILLYNELKNGYAPLFYIPLVADFDPKIDDLEFESSILQQFAN